MRIMIIGGTSGIGLALAEHYAGQGAQVAVCGRDLGRLGQQRFSHQYQFDIADRGAVTAAVQAFGADGLNLLIVTAGQYADAAGLAAAPALGVTVVGTNIGGLCNAFDAAGAVMRAQGHGQLVAVASIAGLLPDYPGGSLYSASKRAAIAICASYRAALAPYGIAVTTLVPGYIDTARLRELNHGSAAGKPFLLTEAEGVRRMVDAIEGRVPQCVFPWQLHAMVRAFHWLPAWLQQRRAR
jgi:NAD(P)-dependent dehydrogenase (short-subunit alcohol dehydrogenase family)